MSDTAEVLERHLAALAAGDIDALMADYADDAVMISGPNPIRGCDAIKQVFNAIAASPPNVQVDTQVVEGDVAYITWHSDQMAFGTDTFVVRAGKIIYQTVAHTR